jgi:hypothetical protein
LYILIIEARYGNVTISHPGSLSITQLNRSM